VQPQKLPGSRIVSETKINWKKRIAGEGIAIPVAGIAMHPDACSFPNDWMPPRRLAVQASSEHDAVFNFYRLVGIEEGVRPPSAMFVNWGLDGLLGSARTSRALVTSLPGS
jgi:hypothetical protein